GPCARRGPIYHKGHEARKAHEADTPTAVDQGRLPLRELCELRDLCDAAGSEAPHDIAMTHERAPPASPTPATRSRRDCTVSASSDSPTRLSISSISSGEMTSGGLKQSESLA